MSKKSIIFDRKKYKSQDMVRFYKQGYDVLCSVCHAKLIVIPDLEEAKVKDPGHPGIFCPTSPNHVYTTFTMNRKEFWNSFEKKLAKRKKENVAKMRQKGCSEAEIKAFVDKNYPSLRGNYS